MRGPRGPPRDDRAVSAAGEALQREAAVTAVQGNFRRTAGHPEIHKVPGNSHKTWHYVQIKKNVTKSISTPEKLLGLSLPEFLTGAHFLSRRRGRVTIALADGWGKRQKTGQAWRDKAGRGGLDAQPCSHVAYARRGKAGRGGARVFEFLLAGQVCRFDLFSRDAVAPGTESTVTPPLRSIPTAVRGSAPGPRGGAGRGKAACVERINSVAATRARSRRHSLRGAAEELSS